MRPASVDEHQVVFLPLQNGAAAKFWDHHVKERLAHGAHLPVHVAVYDTRTRKWTPVAMDVKCPLCVPDSLLNNKSKRWVRFESDHISTWRLAHSSWTFKQIIARGQHKFLSVVVKSPHGPVVYGSVRSSGIHLPYSTQQNGMFRILLKSEWAMSPRPDYVVISPVRSWVDVARRYMLAQTAALTGADQFPEFTGSVEQIVDAAVRYVLSQGIRYDDKLDVGEYPNKTVDAILGARKTDCKGLTTLLYALLRKSGVKADPVLLNTFGMTPLSFGVPDSWANHVMLYVPAIDRYIDPTVIQGSHGKYTWRTSADPYAGDVVLDLVTGRFGAVPQ